MTRLIDVPGNRYGWRGALVLPAEYFPQEVLRLKVWTGTEWVAKPVKVWNGSAWVGRPVRAFTGGEWR